MLKRLMTGPLVRRAMGSRRLRVAIGVAVTFFVASILFLFEVWNLAAFLFSLGLLVFVLITIESLQGIMSAQNEMRRQNRRQLTMMNSYSMNTGSVKFLENKQQSQSGVRRQSIGSRTQSKWEGDALSELIGFSAIRDWTLKNNIDGNLKVSPSAALALWEDYTENGGFQVLHIGSVSSALWLQSVVHAEERKVTNLTVLIAEPDIDLQVLTGQGELSINFYAENMISQRPPGGSIGALTAHMVDVIYIDLAALPSHQILRDNLPRYFIPWLRAETRIVLVDSRTSDIRKSTQGFLDIFPELLLTNMHSGYGYATLTKATE